MWTRPTLADQPVTVTEILRTTVDIRLAYRTCGHHSGLFVFRTHRSGFIGVSHVGKRNRLRSDPVSGGREEMEPVHLDVLRFQPEKEQRRYKSWRNSDAGGRTRKI